MRALRIEPSTLLNGRSVVIAAMAQGKALPTLLSIAICAALLWPISENWRESPKDDFPLSYCCQNR